MSLLNNTEDKEFLDYVKNYKIPNLEQFICEREKDFQKELNFENLNLNITILGGIYIELTRDKPHLIKIITIIAKEAVENTFNNKYKNDVFEIIDKVQQLEQKTLHLINNFLDKKDAFLTDNNFTKIIDINKEV